MILYGLLNTKLSDMSDKVVVTIPEKVLCKAIQIKDCRAEAFCGWWSKVYRESSSRKRNIENEEQYHEYQIWHVGVQEELDELKQEKRNIKKQIQLADGIVKEDLYTAYYAVSEKEEIVADRDVEIPGMEDEAVSEKDVAVEPETNVLVINPDNNQNEIGRQKEQADSARKQQTDLGGIGIPEILNLSDVNMTRMDESIINVTSKSELVNMKKKSLWTKLAGLSGEYQSLVVLRMSVILLRQMYSDLILLM